MKRVLYKILLLASLLGSHGAWAETESRLIPVFQRYTAQAKPSECFLLLKDDLGGTYVKKAKQLNLQRSDTQINSTPVVGAYLAIDGRATHLVSRLVSVDENGAISVGPIQELMIPEQSALNSDELLRADISRKRQNLSELQQDLSYAEQKLKRLQREADAIGNVREIIHAEDNLAIVTGDLARFEQLRDSLKQDLLRISEGSSVRNYAAREAELISQVNALAAFTRSFEADTGIRRSDSYQSFAEKMSLIESTKGEQLDRLREELNRIQRRKAALLNQ